jgi:type IV secretory pathway VirB6-like protein
MSIDFTASNLSYSALQPKSVYPSITKNSCTRTLKAEYALHHFIEANNESWVVAILIIVAIVIIIFVVYFGIGETLFNKQVNLYLRSGT